MEQSLNKIMNQEIARELFLEKGVEISDETLDLVFEASGGNPWDCPTVYEILKVTGKIK